MRFMIIVKAARDSEAGVMPNEALLSAMQKYHEELVKSREEAIELTKRFPNPSIDGKAGEIEVRPFFELEDFGDSPAIERFREMGAGKGK